MAQYVIDELKKKYNEKKIIPFIGAGLSVPFALKPWDELISELKEGFLDKPLWPAIDEDINLGEYQEAIDDIKKFGKIGDQPIQEKIADNYSLESLMTIYANTENVDEVLAKIYAHVHISSEKVAAPKLIEAIITK